MNTYETAFEAIAGAGRLTNVRRLADDNSMLLVGEGRSIEVDRMLEVTGLFLSFQRLTWGVKINRKGLWLVLGDYPLGPSEGFVDITQVRPWNKLQGQKLARV